MDSISDIKPVLKLVPKAPEGRCCMCQNPTPVGVPFCSKECLGFHLAQIVKE